VITLPVSDVERALRFYVDQVGFTLDVDYAPSESFRVVQLTPPGSACSIQIGKGLNNAAAGSVRNVYLVVADLVAARSRLLEGGVEVGEIRHKIPIEAWDGSFAPGSDPARKDYASFADSSDRTATPGCCRNAVTAILSVLSGGSPVPRRRHPGECRDVRFFSVATTVNASIHGSKAALFAEIFP
jgi:catechol 2,3-dioxygenase-like lactoylglutathione lyase family enzyme